MKRKPIDNGLSLLAATAALMSAIVPPRAVIAKKNFARLVLCCALLAAGLPATQADIEQASTFGWERYVGDAGRVIGMETFGASAPLKELQNKFGFEPDRVVATVKEMLGKK